VGDLRQKGSILSIDGTDKLHAWKESQDSRCDSVQGLREPTLLPPLPDEEMNFYVGLICRGIKLIADDGSKGHMDSKVFRAAEDVFEDKCYVGRGVGERHLKRGSMDLGMCAGGAPLSASYPHFLHADPW